MFDNLLYVLNFLCRFDKLFTGKHWNGTHWEWSDGSPAAAHSWSQPNSDPGAETCSYHNVDGEDKIACTERHPVLCETRASRKYILDQ